MKVTLTYFDGNTYIVDMPRKEVASYLATMNTIQVEKIECIAI